MPTRLLWALAIVVVFAILMSRKDRKRRQSVWTGVVTDIKHQRPATRDEERSDDDWVTVLYQTDEGQDGKLKLRMASFRHFFTVIRVGDRLIKHQGDYLPCRAPAEAAELAELPAAEQADVA